MGYLLYMYKLCIAINYNNLGITRLLSEVVDKRLGVERWRERLDEVMSGTGPEVG